MPYKASRDGKPHQSGALGSGLEFGWGFSSLSLRLHTPGLHAPPPPTAHPSRPLSIFLRANRCWCHGFPRELLVPTAHGPPHRPQGRPALGQAGEGTGGRQDPDTRHPFRPSVQAASAPELPRETPGQLSPLVRHAGGRAGRAESQHPRSRVGTLRPDPPGPGVRAPARPLGSGGQQTPAVTPPAPFHFALL